MFTHTCTVRVPSQYSSTAALDPGQATPGRSGQSAEGRVESGLGRALGVLVRVAALATLCLVAAACHRSPASAVPGRSLRVMTYNIAAGGGDLGAVVRTIRAAAPDVVALQEVDVHWLARSKFADQAAELSAALGMEVRFAPIYTIANGDSVAPARQYGVALLSRFPISAFRNHLLTRLSTQSARATPVPMPGFLEATIDVRGTPVRVFNTHLDYRGDPALRMTQVQETLAILRDASAPALLFGDLNATPAAAELAPLLAILRDLWMPGAGQGWSYPAKAPVKRIDYVLGSAHFTVRSSRVVESVASDHRPVVMELSLGATRR